MSRKEEIHTPVELVVIPLELVVDEVDVVIPLELVVDEVDVVIPLELVVAEVDVVIPLELVVDEGFSVPVVVVLY